MAKPFTADNAKFYQAIGAHVRRNPGPSKAIRDIVSMQKRIKRMVKTGKDSDGEPLKAAGMASLIGRWNELDERKLYLLGLDKPLATPRPKTVDDWQSPDAPAPVSAPPSLPPDQAA